MYKVWENFECERMEQNMNLEELLDEFEEILKEYHVHCIEYSNNKELLNASFSKVVAIRQKIKECFEIYGTEKYYEGLSNRRENDE
jgi:hypothetical protein